MKIKFQIVLEVDEKNNMLPAKVFAEDILDAMKTLLSGVCKILWGDAWKINYEMEIQDDKKNNSIFSLN